jgi:hypothetical protein
VASSSVAGREGVVVNLGVVAECGGNRVVVGLGGVLDGDVVGEDMGENGDRVGVGGGSRNGGARVVLVVGSVGEGVGVGREEEVGASGGVPVVA